MSENISLTAEGYHGTQMKPDMFEAATAEWAGRVAKNAGWLFAHQQQVLFNDGSGRLQIFDEYYSSFYQLFGRRFWFNEVFGTAIFRFNISLHEDTDLLVVQGTLAFGGVIGTCEGSYVSGGWKTLTMYLDPDWHNGTVNTGYANLVVRCSIWGLLTKEAIFSYCSLTGMPRT